MVASNYLTALETKALLIEGKITVDQILKDHQDRYNERDEQVNAWVCVDHAKGSHIQDRPLRGMVIGIKDSINTKDFPTEIGSVIYKGSQPSEDAAVVALLRTAGASIIGKTTLVEFSWCGPYVLNTTNPFNSEHMCGTTSSGSAAAVADYQCHVAIGTQSSASLIRPASYCGVFGFVPTVGLVQLEGIRPLQPISKSIGILARFIFDIQLVARTLGVMRNQIPNLSHTALKQCRFGFLKTELFDKHGSESVKSVWQQAKEALTQAGALVEEIDLGKEYNGWEGTGGKLDTFIDAGGSVACFRECTLHRDLVSDAVLERVEKPVSRVELAQIMDDLAALRPKFDKIAKGYDAIITPSSLVEAPKLSEKDVPDYSALWSALGVPMINVPGFGGINGLPIGLLLVAPRYDDERLLHVAKMVAEVFIDAGKGGLRKVPAPERAVHLKP